MTDAALSALRGRRALLTGGSDGIGREIALALAGLGVELLLPVRDRAKGGRVVEAIRERAPGARVELLDLDLARLDTVAALVATLRDRGEPIELLILNAGIIAAGQARELTADGFEPTLQVNYLGHAALTLGLLPLLRAGRARVVPQSSLVAARGRLGRDPGWRELGPPMRAYRASKIAIGMLGIELARRAGDDGVTVQACHPGLVPGSAIAPGIRAALPAPLVRWGSARVGNPPAAAAQTAIAALASAGAPPRLFVPSGPFELAGRPRERAPFPSIADPARAALLWDETLSLLGITDPS